MAQRPTADEVVFACSTNFLEPRYEPPQGCDMHLFPNRIMIGQLQFLLMLPIPFMSIPEGTTNLDHGFRCSAEKRT
jgi:hypothetical protein